MTLTEAEQETATDQTGGPLTGRSIPRVEDARLLTGGGRFLADVQIPEMKHAAIVRSRVAHGRIRNIDLAAALEAPGVVAAFDGRMLATVSRPLSHLLPIPTIKPLEWHVLATEKVRFVGEPVAIVIAESRSSAEDAAELVDVEYDELTAVTDAVAALADGSPLLYEEWDSNDFLSHEHVTGDVDAAFAAADGVLSERITQHRVIGLPLEGHGACAQFDASTGKLLVYASNQQPHNLRTVLSDVTGVSEARITVIAPDMGGGFGNKQHFMREECLIAVVALQVPFPVSWIQDRYESLVSSVHSREQVHDVEIAYRSNGRVLGMRTKIVADIGSPELYFTGASPALVTTSLLTGTYDIRAFSVELHCAVTNKCPIGAYRGFGQPQAFVTIERMMDLLAETLGLDPAEVRRRNFIPDEPRPYVSVTGARYDTGSFPAQFEDLLDLLGYGESRSAQEAARREGRFVGIGLASIVEATAPNLHSVAGRFGGFELASVTVQPDGHVNVVAGTKSQGQGHATFLSQLVGDELALPLEMIDVQEGDTALLAYGMGTWGSRSAVMAGGAVIRASRKLRDKMRAIAANMLQADTASVELSEGMFRSAGAELPFVAVANAAYLHPFLVPPDLEFGLTETVVYDPRNTSYFPDEQGAMNVAATYATAAGGVVVEVDPATGAVAILDAALVHDCGRVINPLIVDGQIQGALAQAVGAILLEEITYDHDGQPQTVSLLDYLVPAFGSVPRVRIRHRETPSELEGGFRGAGEAGIIVMPAALVNAVDDALRPIGVRVRQTSLRPKHVRRLVREAGFRVDPLAPVRLHGLNIS